MERTIQPKRQQSSLERSLEQPYRIAKASRTARIIGILRLDNGVIWREELELDYVANVCVCGVRIISKTTIADCNFVHCALDMYCAKSQECDLRDP